MGKTRGGLETTPRIRPQIAAPVVGWWLAACVAGGALAGAATAGPMVFVGWLFLFGAALGAAQAVFLWRWCLHDRHPAAAWLAGSFGGWALGAVTSGFYPDTLPVETLPG